MKSLSILLLLFATSEALSIEDYSPKESVIIGQGRDLTLFCKLSNGQMWHQCEFTHESNSCQLEWKDRKAIKYSHCSDRMTVGKTINGYKCEVKINEVSKGDGGTWNCKLTKLDGESANQEIQVQFKSEENLDEKPSHQVNNTKETSTLMGVRSAILAFTFLITAVFVAGCLVLLPKNWPLLRDQCCSWK